MSKILVIAAHPDDEVLGCGGMMAKRTAEGAVVDVLILGEGATSRTADRMDCDAAEVRQLQDDAEAAASISGVRKVHFGGLPDNRFDTVPLLDVIKKIEAVLDAVQPDEVFTQHGGDLNVDHEITFRATLTAVRPLQGQGVKAVYAYEVASSTEWSFQRFSPVFRPSLFVDITETLNRKIEAMNAYEKEVRTAPHPRSPEVLRAIAARWGSVVGVHAAEAFETVWEIK